MDNRNPFLVLGLPSNATTAEIREVGQRALMRARLLVDEDAESLHAIQDAVEALRDPVVRFHAGVEWPAVGPRAAELLRTHPERLNLRDNPEAARADVVKLLCDGESQAGASHIRGVFLLLRAYAIVAMHSQQRTPAKGSIAPPIGIVKDLLSDGIDAWGTAIASTEFWMTQRLRARELDDPRLSPNEVRLCQERAMDLALGRFAKLAQDALKRRDAQTCRTITDGLMRYAAKQPAVSNVLADVYGPLSGRVAIAIDGLSKTLENTKGKTAAPYEALLDKYKSDIGADIDLMLAVGDLPGTNEERARDGAAGFLRRVAIKAANEADAYSTSKRALSYAARAVSSQSIRKQIGEDMATIAELAVNSERAAKTKPYTDRLHEALARQDLLAALIAIDALLPLENAESRNQLAELRTRVSSGVATELFNSAMALSRSGNPSAAVAALKQALTYETVPAERAIIESALLRLYTQRVPAEKAGCIIPLVLGVSLVGAAIAGATALVPHTNLIIALLRSPIAP